MFRRSFAGLFPLRLPSRARKPYQYCGRHLTGETGLLARPAPGPTLKIECCMNVALGHGDLGTRQLGLAQNQQHHHTASLELQQR